MYLEGLPLPINDLRLLLPDPGSLLDLLYEHALALVARLDFLLLSLFFLVQRLEPLDLHHEIKLLLFFDVFFLELLALFDLLVANGDDFRVEANFIHFFHVVQLFIKLLLGAREQTLGSLLLLEGKWALLHLALSFLVKSCHLVLLNFGCLHALLELCLFHFLLHQYLFGRLVYHIGPDSIDLTLGQDDCIFLEPFLCPRTEFSELMHRNDADSWR